MVTAGAGYGVATRRRVLLQRWGGQIWTGADDESKYFLLKIMVFYLNDFKIVQNLLSTTTIIKNTWDSNLDSKFGSGSKQQFWIQICI